MSTEDDICLWCQDSLSAQGLVIELSSEDFKEMFKYDCSCKIIHYDCYQDYKKKQAKDDLENEQQRASEHTEPTPIDRSTQNERSRVLFAVLLADPMRSISVSRLQIVAAVWRDSDRYYYLLPRVRTMVRPVEPQENFYRSSPRFARAPVRYPQEFEMSMPYPPYQPQGYFPGNPSTMPEHHIYSREYQGIPPRTCIPNQFSPAGTYNMYSTTTHTRSIAGYQSGYQECTQRHWTAQSHNEMFAYP